MVSDSFALHPNIYCPRYTVRVCGSVGAVPGYLYILYIYLYSIQKGPQTAPECLKLLRQELNFKTLKFSVT